MLRSRRHVATSWIVLMLAIACAATSNTQEPAPDYKVIGYFTNWVENRKGCEFKVEQIDPQLFTHINFAFARVDPGPGGKEDPSWRIAPFGDPATSTDLGAQGLYARLDALKSRNPHLKTLLAIGGWTHNDSAMAWIFTTMAESRGGRAQFISSAIDYAREHRFDGIDLDWEYPVDTTRGGRPIDRKNFTSLLKEFRDAITREARRSRKPALLFTVAMPAGDESRFYELSQIHKYVDWINLMTYDYSGGWSPTTGANAPNPRSARGRGIRSTVVTYMAARVPARKIVLGMPTYGRVFAGVESAQPGSQSKGAGPKMRCSNENGFATYFEVNELLESGQFRRYWDDSTATPYAYDARNKVWISYDDPESFSRKLDVIENMHLGGAMFWAIDLDDYVRGYPLISMVANRLRKQRADAP